MFSRFAVLLAVFVTQAVMAQSGTPSYPQGGTSAYPSKQVRMVVPFPPGASNDIMARIAAQRMSQAWGQPVVVENRPGANTIIGAEMVVKSPPDGHTLLIGASSTYTVNPALYPKLPYDPVRDLAPVTLMGSLALVIAVNPAVQANTIGELIALAKSRPRQINYGTPTVTFHVAVESFSQRVGMQTTRVPYNGSVPTVTGLIAGDIQFVFMDPPPVIPQIKAGKVRAIAVTSLQRVPYLPDVPTVSESGVPGFELIFWTGLFAPSATPREIIGRVQAEAARAMHAPENRERFATMGIVPVGNTPEEFAALLKVEAARYAKVIKEANIKAE
jgi:tripartite-type tricarboxylate transporter receptor subunit TctC